MRGGSHSRRTGVLMAAVLAMLASIICLAVANRTSSAKPRPVAFVSGAFSLADSKDGGAILTVSNMGPGDSVTGRVTIRNTGTGTGALALSMMNLTDSPGVNHGALSGALGLQLTDITHGSDAAVYSGGLGAMPEQRLVTLPQAMPGRIGSRWTSPTTVVPARPPAATTPSRGPRHVSTTDGR